METKEKRNFKQEIKDLWNENKGKIKVGGICLLVGCFYGFVKGMNAQGQLTGKAMTDLIDKIPELPEPDDLTYEEMADMLKGYDMEVINELVNQQ